MLVHGWLPVLPVVFVQCGDVMIYLISAVTSLLTGFFGFFGGFYLGYSRAMREARKPRFPAKIPCAGCGDRESMSSLGQCSDCGGLFCCGCFNLDPDDIYEGPWLCEKCQGDRKKRSDAAFPTEFARRQTAIHGVPPEEAAND